MRQTYWKGLMGKHCWFLSIWSQSRWPHPVAFDIRRIQIWQLQGCHLLFTRMEASHKIQWVCKWFSDHQSRQSTSLSKPPSFGNLTFLNVHLSKLKLVFVFGDLHKFNVHFKFSSKIMKIQSLRKVGFFSTTCLGMRKSRAEQRLLTLKQKCKRSLILITKMPSLGSPWLQN